MIPLQDARDVAEHVELAEVRDRRGHRVATRRRIRDVEPLCHGLATARRDRRHRLVERGVVDVRREDARALGGEPQRRRPTDPGCSASDESNLAGEAFHGSGTIPEECSHVNALLPARPCTRIGAAAEEFVLSPLIRPARYVRVFDESVDVLVLGLGAAGAAAALEASRAGADTLVLERAGGGGGTSAMSGGIISSAAAPHSRRRAASKIRPKRCSST